jgi:hypothetical protein
LFGEHWLHAGLSAQPVFFNPPAFMSLVYDYTEEVTRPKYTRPQNRLLFIMVGSEESMNSIPNRFADP